MSFTPSEISKYITSLFGSKSHPTTSTTDELWKKRDEEDRIYKEQIDAAKAKAIAADPYSSDNIAKAIAKAMAKEIQKYEDKEILEDLKVLHGIKIGGIGSGPLGLGPVEDANQCDDCYYFDETKKRCFYHNKQITTNQYTCAKWREI